MSTNEQVEFFTKELKTLTDRYKNESSRYKKTAFRLKIISVLLAAIITVLLGIKFGDASLTNALSNVSLVLGASITVLSAYEAFFDPKALWVRETVTFVRLKDLQRDLDFWRSGIDPNEITTEELNKFKIRLDLILEDTLKYWMKIRGAPDMEKNLEARADLRGTENTD
ncbi:MAG: DUF4231 domain-containing protein [Bacteroidales bacterium]|nr:DUF4231 domain-containing protein [Bacteroidales bacterium]MCF8455490.1 DUF4231 domain-containing protein [Bacteroidales bacterium]